MKYLTDQFQLRFCFCIGNAKQLYFNCALGTQLASLQTTCWLFCLVLHSGIWCSCRMGIQSWYFCVRDVEMFVQDRYQCCVIFACFAVFLIF